MVNGKVLDRWPEVFGEVTCNVVPLHYLNTITITFKNGKVWEIDVNDKDDAWDTLESQVKEIIGEYETAIENVDFQLDTESLKKDIIKHTKKFLNNKKLK